MLPSLSVRAPPLDASESRTDVPVRQSAISASLQQTHFELRMNEESKFDFADLRKETWPYRKIYQIVHKHRSES